MNGTTQLDLTIIVACRNEESHIREFVDSILRQKLDTLSWEAIIADGASTDATPGILAEICAKVPQLRVISNPGRTVSKGLNLAIRMARGAYILRMDAHTIYSETYCVDCIETLNRTGADNAGGPARTRVHGTKATAIAAAYHSPFSTGGAKFHDPNYEGWVDTVTYGCWRRETFDKIGLFDEDLVRNQDDEFNLRLVRAGGKIWQSSSIVSWYSPRSTIRGLFQQYFQYGFWKVYVIRKHKIPGSWRHLVPATLVLSLAGLPLLALAAWILGAGTLATVVALGWIGLLGAYVAGILFASALTASANQNIQILPWLPVAFAAFHFSYGAGFLIALVKSLGASKQTAGGDSVFVKLTR